MYRKQSRKKGVIQMKKLDMSNKINANVVTLAAVYIYIYTHDLLKKINRMNINKACKLSMEY